MSEPDQADQPLGRVLDAAEDASPLEAVEAVTEALAQSLGASAAFFLIADLSGRALVRMSHGASDDQLAGQGLGGPEAGARLDDGDQAVVVNFDDGPVATALRTQTVQVLPPLPGDAAGRGRAMDRARAGHRAR